MFKKKMLDDINKLPARKQGLISFKVEKKDRGQYDNIENVKCGRNIINCIFKAFELIGLFKGFKGTEEEFKKRYPDWGTFARYYHRNRGIDEIYDRLKEKNFYGVGIRKYYISKRSLRRTGMLSPYNYLVRVYEGTAEIIKEILLYIEKYPVLKEMYYEKVHKKLIEEYLLFQLDCINKYEQKNSSGPRRKDHYTEMKVIIGDMIKNKPEVINE